MKILIFSDSHGETTNMINIINERKPNFVIHLGDFEDDAKILYELFPNIIYIKGNNDTYSRNSDNKIITIDNFRFFICHGHNFDVNSGIDEIINIALLNNCKIALYGHTHIKHKSIHNDIIILNPGSITCPRDNTKSYGEITISNHTITAKLIILGE